MAMDEDEDLCYEIYLPYVSQAAKALNPIGLTSITKGLQHGLTRGPKELFVYKLGVLKDRGALQERCGRAASREEVVSLRSRHYPVAAT